MRLFSLPDFKSFGQSLKKILIFFRDPPYYVCYLGFRYVVLLTKQLFCSSEHKFMIDYNL